MALDPFVADDADGKGGVGDCDGEGGGKSEGASIGRSDMDVFGVVVAEEGIDEDVVNAPPPEIFSIGYMGVARGDAKLLLVDDDDDVVEAVEAEDDADEAEEASLMAGDLFERLRTEPSPSDSKIV